MSSKIATILLSIVSNAYCPLDSCEQGLIGELEYTKRDLADQKIELPLKELFPDYPNFREVYAIVGCSTEDLLDGKHLTKPVVNLAFEGIRPGSWKTTHAAAETANL